MNILKRYISSLSMTFRVERDWEKTSRKHEKHISWKISIEEGGYMKNMRKNIFYIQLASYQEVLLYKKHLCLQTRH
jgi:hypothetical protein